MRLFVANPTPQRQLIYYRLDFDREGNPKDTNRRFQPAFQQEIAPGTQAQLGPDLHKNQVDDIIRQLEVYGIVHASVVKDTRRRIAYIFNVDAPVPADVMRRAQFHNNNVLVEDGRVRRAKAAVASNNLIQETVHNQFLEHGIPAQPADSTAVSFEQEEQTEMQEKRIEEGYEIVPEGKRGTRSGKLGMRRRR